jgi:hypothetical protein
MTPLKILQSSDGGIERLENKGFPGTIPTQDKVDMAELRPIDLGQGAVVLQF